MALSQKEKLHILKILAEESKDGVTLARLLHGTVGIVEKNGAVYYDSGQDKVDGTQEEIMVYWQKLQNEGYICQIDLHNKDHFKLTEDGKTLYESMLNETPIAPYIDIENVISNEVLALKTKELFNGGNYDTAIREATVLLEEAVRVKANATPNDFGIALMTLALKSNTGKLVIPYCQTENEEEGAYLLYRGMVSFIRNIVHHRIETFNDKVTAMKVLSFIDFLLHLLDQAQLR